VKIYFTVYLIPVVVVALLVFWLALRRDRPRLLFLLLLSVGVLALLHPIFAAVAVGLVLVTHQLVELQRKQRLRGSRVVLVAIILALITLGIGKYGRDGAMAIWGQDDWSSPTCSCRSASAISCSACCSTSSTACAV